ncbi:MAG: DNA replication/repair protein RecF [Chloroflexi bacterium]|nr:MAG: DNA replication/repair protein RecF [Chloroflexota bacterium]MBL1195657.1 DNA replication/repair protein RecF [Chloroflexota bacterium]
MRLTHLSLTQFRNFARLDINVPQGAVLLVGPNAQGKTSVLEAIYYLATMTSFHASTDRELVNFIEARKPLAVGRIVADYEKNNREHRLEVRIIQEQTRKGVVRARKEVLLDNAKKKMSEVVGHFNAVLFLPQMLRVVEGSPSERRRYLDLAISQVDSDYAADLSEYGQILSQRNALLKQLGEQGGDANQLAFWDERLAMRGARLIHTRVQAIQELEGVAGGIHHSLTRGSEVLRMSYRPAYDPAPTPENQMALMDAPQDRSQFSVDKIESGFREALEALRKEEIARGVTTIGPHRDELRFISNGVDLGTYGSRGQVRTTMLTLRMAEVEWMKSKTGEWPVLLLDEVLAELDNERREDLLGRVAQSEQALLTTTDLNLFEKGFEEGAEVWELSGGRLNSEKKQ